MKKEIQLTKGEVNEFIDYGNDLVFILESEEQYVGTAFDDVEVYDLYYTAVKVCYDYNTDLVVKLTEEEKKQILKLANGYED